VTTPILPAPAPAPASLAPASPASLAPASPAPASLAPTSPAPASLAPASPALLLPALPILPPEAPPPSALFHARYRWVLLQELWALREDDNNLDDPAQPEAKDAYEALAGLVWQTLHKNDQADALVPHDEVGALAKLCVQEMRKLI
jgi:hypothetical protein